MEKGMNLDIKFPGMEHVAKVFIFLCWTYYTPVDLKQFGDFIL